MQNINPDLRAALNILKSSARSLSDIREWLMSHIELLTGNAVLPALYCIDMKLSCNDANMWVDVANLGALVVNAPLTLVARFHPNPILTPEDPTEKLSYVCCKNDFNLSLDLDAWPFACGYVTGMFFTASMPMLTEQCKALFLAKLDAALTLHFPGFTRERLEDLIAAEIIPVDSYGRPNKYDVMNLLFSSKEPAGPVATPSDLV